MNNHHNFDLIGDIHGHADALHALLEKLGYEISEGYYRHPARKVIFLGDFIDRGPDQKGVLDTVMGMVRNNAALAVMGNHEFNALAFHTEDPECPDSWLRPRNTKNIKQHNAFLEEYKETPEELAKVLDFFWSLPLWLDLNNIRATHACWDQGMIDSLMPLVGPNNTLTPSLLEKASREGTNAFIAVETLLKGVELPIPGNGHFFDKDGIKRHHVRTQWWHNKDKKLNDISMPPGILSDNHKDKIITSNMLVGYANDEKPLFIGHYWLTGKPEPLAHNIACLDYSVAKAGKLVALYWSNGTGHFNERQ